MPRLLAQGTLISGRFVVEHVVSNSMAAVYRAIDSQTSGVVALKVLTNTAADLPPQALREITWLTRLSSPNIVRYVAHGELPSGGLFVATEWIEGEDLAQRLLRQPLTLAESLLVLRKIAEALSIVHGEGIIHSDIKPANVLLRNGELERIVLLDFGIARQMSPLARFTPGHDNLVGTLGYLAPERARGAAELSPRTDIFSLGCVLFECLTGEVPFAAETAGGVLTRILFDEPLTPQLPNVELFPGVSDLLYRMLAKDPQARPADADALLLELDALESLPGLGASMDQGAASSGEQTLTAGEQRLVTIIVAQDLARHPGVEVRQEVGPAAPHELLRSMLAPFGAEITQLVDDTIIISLTQMSSDEAQDQAEQAVRSALLLKEQWPTAKILVTTGRERVGRRARMGQTVDRAIQLLSFRDPDRQQPYPYHQSLLLDELTASLVDVIFDVVPIGGGRLALEVEQQRLDRSRLLLGRPTPCVGREHDLLVLDTTLSFCTGEPTARMVLVTAPPGFGKSRLRQEFIRRIGRRSNPLRILSGRGDLMGVGSPFQLVASAVRNLCGIDDGEDAAAQRLKLTSYVRDSVPATEAQRIAAFLGELCGIPFSREECQQLAGAYQNPRTMNAQITQAWLDLLSAELSQRPVLLILEDIHWGDALSIALIQASLRELASRPLMILSLGRPELEELFPSLCQERNSWMLRLGRLSRKASERLIRHALGEGATEQFIEKLVRQAEGSPLYLEELVRAVAEEQKEDLPDTVLAMLEARLMRLAGNQRRVLRAASIFGERFDREGVLSLIGRQNSAEGLDRCLAGLIEAELIEPSFDGSSTAPVRFRFRHELFRAAAYDLLTPDDRLLGHRLVAQHLESLGSGRDPRVLAEHYLRGGAPDQARAYFLASAERALANSDLVGALECAEQGASCGAQGELLGGLRAVQLQAHFWSDEWQQALFYGQAALQLLPQGSERWCVAAAIMLPTTSLSGHFEIFLSLAAELPQIHPAGSAVPAFFQAVSYLLITTCLLGKQAEAGQLLELLRRYQQPESSPAGLVEDGLLKFGALVYQRTFGSDLWKNYLLAESATLITTKSGDLRTLLFVQGFLGRALTELGDFESAARVLAECLELAHKLNEPLLTTHIQVQHEVLLLSLGDPKNLAAALDSARRTVDNERTNPLLRGEALTNLAWAQLSSGQLVEAELSARSAEGLLQDIPTGRLFALSLLIETQLRQQRHAEARRLIAEGQEQRRLHPGGDAAAGFLLIVAQVLTAAGDPAASSARAEAKRAFELQSQNIPDRQMRERYLQRVLAPLSL